MAKLFISEIAEKVAEKAIYEVKYEGKTIREWIELILSDNIAEVVRCYKCRHWDDHGNGYGQCRHPRFHIENEIGPTTDQISFCSCGEMDGGE